MSDQKTEQKPEHEKRIREAVASGENFSDNDLRALLAELAEARAALSEAKAGGWQPIETCPRDFGVTKFDVWANGQRYADCWWGKATYEQGESGIVHQSDYDCNGPVDSYVKGATAWQPLPAPPAQKEPT